MEMGYFCSFRICRSAEAIISDECLEYGTTLILLSSFSFMVVVCSRFLIDLQWIGLLMRRGG